MSLEYIQEVELEKFNPYHDARGRFTTAGNARSFTIRTRGGAYQQGMVNRAIEREKKRTKETNEANNRLSKPTGNMELDRKKEWENAECAVRIGSPSPFNENQTDISVVDFSGAGAKEEYNTVKGDARNYGEKVYLLTYDQYNNAVAKLDDENAFANYDSKQVANFKNNIEKDNVRVLDNEYLQEQKNSFDKNHTYDIPKGGSLPSDLDNIKLVSGDTFPNKAALKAAGFKWNSRKRVWEKLEDVVKNNVEYIDEPASFDILKSDDDKHLVFGWASIVQNANGETIEDIQKDIIEPEDLEDAAYEYVLNFRDTGEEHLPGYRKKGKLIESCVFTEEKQRAMGLAPGSLPVGWWIGFHIEDDDAWRRIKDGTYKMFSIEGKAERVPVEKKAPTGCGVIVLNNDGEVLTGNRAKENVIGGPGGHIEDGETPEEAAVRETFEEFGIVCRDLQPLCVLDGGEKYGDSAIFLCKDYSGRIKTDNKEMTEPQWLSVEDLEDKELFLPFAQSIDLLSKEGIEKGNPYHDPKTGRFTNKPGGVGNAKTTSGTVDSKEPSKQSETQKFDRDKELSEIVERDGKKYVTTIFGKEKEFNIPKVGIGGTETWVKTKDDVLDLKRTIEADVFAAETDKDLIKAMKHQNEHRQKGVANKDNFFWETAAEFEEVPRRPRRKPDYVSLDRDGKVSSEYWYTKDGVIRGSKHWGPGVATCDWTLDTIKGDGERLHHTNKIYGKANWEDFTQKFSYVKDNDGEFVGYSNFENTLGKGHVRINDRDFYYVRGIGWFEDDEGHNPDSLNFKETKKNAKWGDNMNDIEYITEVEKFNPYHDSRGRFTTASGAKSFTIRTRGGAYQQGMVNRAIEREKRRTGGTEHKFSLTGHSHKLPNLDSEQAERDRKYAIGKVEEQAGHILEEFERKTKYGVPKVDNVKMNAKFEKYVSETDPKVWSKRAKMSKEDAWYDFNGTPKKEVERRRKEFEAKRTEEKRKHEDIQNMRAAMERAKSANTKKAKEYREYQNELFNKYKDESLYGPEKYNYWSRATDAEKQKLLDLEAALVKRDKNGKWRVAKSEGEFWDDEWEYTENQGIQKSVSQNNNVECIIELEKFNPYHDERGRFATANSHSFFTIQTKDPGKQH